MMRNEQLEINVKLKNLVGEAIEASFSAEEMAEMGYMPKNPAKAMAVSAVNTNRSLTTEEFYENSINRWSQNGKSHSNPPVKGFIGVAVRRALMSSLRTKFSQKEAIRGYYSCLIDIFYATLDWGAAVKRSSDGAVAITRKRLVRLIDELNRWLIILQLPALTRTTVKRLIQLVLNNRSGRNLKNLVVYGLTELNTSVKPKSIDYLVKASLQTVATATA